MDSQKRQSHLALLHVNRGCNGWWLVEIPRHDWAHKVLQVTKQACPNNARDGYGCNIVGDIVLDRYIDKYIGCW